MQTTRLERAQAQFMNRKKVGKMAGDMHRLLTNNTCNQKEGANFPQHENLRPQHTQAKNASVKKNGAQRKQTLLVDAIK